MMLLLMLVMIHMMTLANTAVAAKCQPSQLHTMMYAENI